MWLESLKDLIEPLPNNHPLKPDLNAALSPSSSPLFALSIFGLSILVAHHPWSTAFDWDQRNDSGHTALYLACCSGNESLVQFLITMGAEINVECGKHGSPLHAACFHGHRSVVALLLTNKVDTKTGNVYKSAIDAAFRGDHEGVALILLKDPLAVSSQDMHEDILASATQAGSSAVIELLLATSPFAKRVHDRHSRMAIKAITSGKIHGLHFLLRNGANASETLPSHSVAIAAAYGHREVVEFLLDTGLDIQTPGPVGPPLRSASLVGHEPTVRALIDRGANVNANDFFGNAFHAAAMKGHMHVVKLLLSAGADVDLEGDFYGNALQAAAFRGHKDVVELLLDAGADMHASGYTKDAFHAASEGGHEDIVVLLIDHGYEFLRPRIVSCSGRSSTGSCMARPRPVHDPPAIDMSDVLQRVTRCDSFTKLALWDQRRLRAKSYASADSADFALEAAAAGGHVTVVQQILDSSNSLALNSLWDTSVGKALRHAVTTGHLEIVDLILRSPWTTDYPLDGELEIAVASGDLPLVNIIMEHFAKRDIKPQLLESVLRGACSGSHAVVLRCLNWCNEALQGTDLRYTFPAMLENAAAAGNLETMRLVLHQWQNPSEKDLKRAFQAACSSQTAEGLLLIRKAMDSSLTTPAFVSASVLSAAANPHSDVMPCALTLLGTYLNDSHLSKAVFRASEDGRLENLKLLLRHCERNNFVLEKMMTQALLVACMAGHFLDCEYLVQEGADVNNTVQYPIDRRQHSFQKPPVGNPGKCQEEEDDAHGEESEESHLGFPELSDHAARELGHDHSGTEHDKGDGLSALQACIEGLKSYQQSHWLDAYGLEYREACASRERILAILLDSGADVNARGGGSDYPLCIAAGVCSANSVSSMIESRANVDLHVGAKTALDAAVERGLDALTVVKVLYRAGAARTTTAEDRKRLIDTALRCLASPFEDTIDGHISCAEGCGAVVRFLLEQDSTLLATDQRFGILLELATTVGDMACIQLLIDRRVDVDSNGRQYGTALIAASRCGQVSAVKALLGAGADPNKTAGMLLTALRAAAKYGHLEIVQILINESRTLVDFAQDNERHGPRSIHPLPALSGPKDAQNSFRQLDGAVTVIALETQSWTPLQLAIRNRHSEVALCLLTAGACVDFSRPDMQHTLIHACACNSVELFESLISHDLRARDRLKDCADLLVEAIKHDNGDVVQFLISCGLGSTVEGKSLHGVDEYVPRKKKDRTYVCRPSPRDQDPLIYAAGHGNPRIVHDLLEACPDRSSRGLGLALCEAARNGRSTIVGQLLDNGACVTDPEGSFNAVTVAGTKGHISIVEHLLESLPVNALQDACADAPALVQEGSESAVELMCRYIPCTRKTLVTACAWNREKIVRLALEQGIDCNSQDCSGSSALHAAAYFGNLRIVDLLLSYGAEVSPRHGNMDDIVRLSLQGLVAPSLFARRRPKQWESLKQQLPGVQGRDLDEYATAQSFRSAGALPSFRERKTQYEQIIQVLLDS